MFFRSTEIPVITFLQLKKISFDIQDPVAQLFSMIVCGSHNKISGDGNRILRVCHKQISAANGTDFCSVAVRYHVLDAVIAFNCQAASI